MNTIERTIRRALQDRQVEDADGRRAVYNFTAHSLTKFLVNRLQEQRERLEKDLAVAIENIEDEHGSGDSVFDRERVLVYDLDQNIEDATKMDQDPMTETTTTIQIEKRSGAVVAIGAVLLIALGIVAYFWAAGIGPFERPVNFVLDLSKWDTSLSASPVNEVALAKDGAEVSLQTADGEPVLSLRGKGAIYTNRSFKIDPKKAYEMSVKLRVLEPTGDGPEATKSPYTAIGLATFDGNLKLLTDDPGPHRYGVLSRSIEKNGQWQTYTGTFTGVAPEHNAFREGTVSVKLVILFNRTGSPESVTQINALTLRELPQSL